MELRHLRYFIAVAESENITRAAEQLHLTQPSLSRQIRDLEELLGLTMFTRGGKSLSLTAKGKLFLAEAKAVVARADEALCVAKRLSQPEIECLRIGYAPSLSVDLLPETLRQLHRALPQLRTELKDLSSREMLEDLRSKSLDLAMMVRTESLLEYGIVFQVLAERSVCVAAAPEHPIFQIQDLRLKDLKDSPLLSFSRHDYPEYHAWLRRQYDRHQLPLRIEESHDGASSLIASLQLGQGVALLHEGMQSFAGSRIALRKLGGQWDPFVLGIARRNETDRQEIQSFIEAAAAAVERIAFHHSIADKEASTRRE